MKKLVGFDKSVIFFNNTIIAKFKRFENIIISVLYARPPVLIVSYRGIVARFNDVQPHSVPLPVFQYPSPARDF